MAEGRSRIWVWLLVGGGLFALFVAGVFTLVYLSLGGGDEESFSGFGPKIGVVELDGVIFSPKQIVPQLKKFADDDSVKAIIIHVNSPGGGVAASEEIFQEVKRIRDEKKKRIVASIETVGASGAYYVASAANKIYADKGSVVGSIGVIAEWVNYGELLRWAKLNAITMKAGEFKDTGSPTREMTPAEREYMQGLIDNMHTQFIRAVADGRHAKEADIRAIADGKVWTGEQAADVETGGSDRGFRRGGEGYRPGGEYLRRTDAGVAAEREAVGPRSFVWRCFRLFAYAGEATGTAGRLLLSLEVAASSPSSVPSSQKHAGVVD